MHCRKERMRKMNAVIKPDTMNILCGSTTHYAPYCQEIPTPQIEQEPSIWERFKSWIKDICETFKPVVDLIVPLFKEVVIPIIKEFHGGRSNDNGLRYRYTNAQFA